MADPTFRTTDMARWGAGAGFDLPAATIDMNFWVLLERIVFLEQNPTEAISIDDFRQEGRQFYVDLTDYTSRGPFDIPVRRTRWRGEWQPTTSYVEDDRFTYNGSVYDVTFDHVSALTFDPAANDGGGNYYYSLNLTYPANVLPDDGLTDQVLIKNSDDPLDTSWQSAGVKRGGTARMIPQKNSGADWDWDWVTPEGLEISIDELSDVDVGTLPILGDVLSFDGDFWIPLALIAGNVVFDPTGLVSVTGAEVQTAIEELDAAVAAVGVGRREIWIPASQMVPRITNGPALNTIELAGNLNMIRSLDFDATTSESAQFDLAMPKSWDLGNIVFVPYWSHPATVTNFGVVWSIQVVAVSNDDTFNVSFGSAVNVIDTGGTTDDIYVGPESTEFTPSGTPAIGDVLQCRFFRNPGNVSDTMTVDARLHGVKIIYTTDQSTDD